jgi:hypothetical protein
MKNHNSLKSSIFNRINTISTNEYQNDGGSFNADGIEGETLAL